MNREKEKGEVIEKLKMKRSPRNRVRVEREKIAEAEIGGSVRQEMKNQPRRMQSSWKKGCFKWKQSTIKSRNRKNLSRRNETAKRSSAVVHWA